MVDTPTLNIPRKTWPGWGSPELERFLLDEGVEPAKAKSIGRGFSRYLEQWIFDEEANYHAIEQWARSLVLSGEGAAMSTDMVGWNFAIPATINGGFTATNFPFPASPLVSYGDTTWWTVSGGVLTLNETAPVRAYCRWATGAAPSGTSAVTLKTSIALPAPSILPTSGGATSRYLTTSGLITTSAGVAGLNLFFSQVTPPSVLQMLLYLFREDAYGPLN